MITSINEYKIYESVNVSKYVNKFINDDTFDMVYMMHDDFDEPLTLKKKKQLLTAYLNDKLSTITKVLNAINNGKKIYRKITIKEYNDELLDKPVGVYWTYDINSARSYNNFNIEDGADTDVIFVATTTMDEIDVDETIEINLYPFISDEEKEIRMKSGGKLELNSIYINNDAMKINKNIKA